MQVSIANNIRVLLEDMKARKIDKRHVGKRNDASMKLHLGTTSLAKAIKDVPEEKLWEYYQHLKGVRDGNMDDKGR